MGLFGFIATMNIGVGLFNLYPLFVLDGGRMVADILEKVSPKHGKRLAGLVFVLALLVLVGTLFPTISGIGGAIISFVVAGFKNIFAVFLPL